MTEKLEHWQEEEIARMREESGSVDSADPLVCFLYVLGRDALPLGTVEELVRRMTFGGVWQFTNGWLAEWAKDLAERLSPERERARDVAFGIERTFREKAEDDETVEIDVGTLREWIEQLRWGEE